MTGSVNRVTLVGNLARDPEVRSTQQGNELVNLTVVTNETWRDRKSGERKERAEFHRVVVFNEHLVKVCKDYLQKGRKVYVEGQLQTRKWQDQSGQDRYSTEVVLGRYRGDIQILDSRETGSTQPSSGGGAPPQLDDEIPFGPEWR